MTGIADNSRRTQRLQVSLAVDFRTPWGQIERISLSDISLGGCCVAYAHAALAPGTRVIIRTASLLGTTGTVRWVQQTRAGIAFDYPLNRAVMDCFARNRTAGASLIVPASREPHMAAIG